MTEKDAWDEGYEAGILDGPGLAPRDRIPNPYVEHVPGCFAEYPLGCHGIECACPCHIPPGKSEEAS